MSVFITMITVMVATLINGLVVTHNTQGIIIGDIIIVVVSSIQYANGLYRGMK